MQHAHNEILQYAIRHRSDTFPPACRHLEPLALLSVIEKIPKSTQEMNIRTQLSATRARFGQNARRWIDRLFPYTGVPERGLTREHVVWAYRLFLDREPESEGAILGNLAAWESTSALRDHFLTSEEFQSRNPAVKFMLETGQDLPIPPPELIYLVSGSTNVAWFLRGGALAAQSIQDTLTRNGLQLKEFRAILDLGCGCGRVLRQFPGLEPGVLHGADYNPSLVDWCQENLPFARYVTNQLNPPLPYADGQFDFIYALSVFTHLPETLQYAWMNELARVTKSGGHLLFTAHGNSYQFDLSPGELRQFQANQLVVKYTEQAGSNTCGAYHPVAYVHNKLAVSAGYKVVDHVPQGAKGNPHQDIYLLRKI